MSLPILDLAPWHRGSETDRSAVAAALRRASTTPGFFYVEGHDVSLELVESIRQVARLFFSLPLEDKLALHFERTGKQRGYIPLRAESSDPAGKGDVKEALDFTFTIAPRNVSAPVARRMYGPNLYPAGIPGFREIVDEYFDRMIGLGRTLFEILATGLALPPEYFRDLTDRPIAQLRLLHYPPQRDGSIDPGIGAHCDYECFTILEQGEVGGLEVRNPEGEWRAVSPIPGTFLVNLGEMLARWTNDLFVATPHRVVNRSGKERYTMPFFFGTNYDTTIACLPTCAGPERPERYPPIQAGEYLAQRLNEVYGALPDAGNGEADEER
jgi:isopenicillin N synthase-like dioxygenase